MASNPPLTNHPSATQPSLTGTWSEVLNLANVAIHTHVLPTGNVLFWGRRKQPTDNSFASLNEWETHTFLLDLQSFECRPTANQPVDGDGKPINLFCSGHTFLPDGRLMVVGGHLFDSQGIDCATIYDPNTDKWTAAEPMQGQTKTDPANSRWKNGRWYPTAITLADGSVLVCSGSFATAPPAPQPSAPNTANNTTPEIWNQKPWTQSTPFGENGSEDLQHFLFPRFHLAPDGRVFMAGAGRVSFFFDTTGAGKWLKSDARQAGDREYAPSVMYEVGKIVFIGGGNDPGTKLPTNIVETIDLTANPPRWTQAKPMNFRRRQHNATLLPDGTVLVTGGTQGGGGLGGQGFNDLSPGEPVHAAELWDPRTDTWTPLAEEQRDRCYHSTAVLLPDGRVLSAGGGEYQPTSALAANDPADTHLDAQIFSPPYLFKGPRPEIQSAPDAISYGQPIKVVTPDAADIQNASLVRLSSVTHSFNPNQRINFLTPIAGPDFVTLTAPATANTCPPGHYLLFLLNKASVPSVGKIVRIHGQVAAPARLSVIVVDQVTKNQAIIKSATRPEVVVGLTATCPYGLAACWGGAYAGLKQLDGVGVVRPIADNAASVAFLYLDHDGLPDIENWPTQFTRATNGSYRWRGVEITLEGAVEDDGGSLVLPANPHRPAVLLAPLQADAKVQLEMENGVRRPLPADEASAYVRLAQQKQRTPGLLQAKVTGPLTRTDAGFVLQVRKFE
jgi:hypothetical protein